MDYFSPGEVVERSGISVETLRYYERIGVLDHIERGPSGRRRFAATDLPGGTGGGRPAARQLQRT
jgi:DNA-binding transcriptional MerR regulator